jgi:hypothetical protein
MLPNIGALTQSVAHEEEAKEASLSIQYFMENPKVLHDFITSE